VSRSSHSVRAKSATPAAIAHSGNLTSSTWPRTPGPAARFLDAPPHIDPSYESCRWRVIDDPAAAIQEIRALVTPSETTEWPPLPDLAEAVGGLDRWMTEHTGPWPDLWGTGWIPKHNNGNRRGTPDRAPREAGPPSE
jgi:hypothetical protein